MSKHLHEKSCWTENAPDGSERHLFKIQHKGLGTYRILKDLHPGLLNKKAENQFRLWDQQWSAILSQNDVLVSKTKTPALAGEATAKARKAIQEIEDIAVESTPMHLGDLSWNALTDHSAFPETDPAELLQRELMHFEEIPEPALHVPPEKPDEADFIPELTFAARKLGFLADRSIARQQKKYHEAIAEWETQTVKLNHENDNLRKIYHAEKARFEAGRQQLIAKYEKAGIVWKRRKTEFYRNQNELNAYVSGLRQSYAYHEPTAVIAYNELILNNVAYPAGFPKDFDLEYNPETKMLVAEYILPSPFHFPLLKEIKYNSSTKDFENHYLSKEQLAGLFETTLYKITLRALHELFTFDDAHAIDTIVFNGWIESVNKRTRKTGTECILSVKADKSKFQKINLTNIDPKTLFENLNGAAASRLIDMVPVNPIAQLNLYDKRFGPSQGGLLSQNYNFVCV
ncbi:hypothetical protein [Dyadobacter sediminis]|uniref:Restriction endonuclease n=1 Tax=Dyadobacter sediminis TaxID=1493691 RepID=A0A5R9KJT7_9BACT|nr:hypothetical protein [Dyadobacter sediminis]TLU96465.1 hypothetical protein FEM55_04850 [Dyadobacter sediminis]GGB82433.1 hypothetical protein GCM10011325_07470 [Dyadobacter sediminis]